MDQGTQNLSHFNNLISNDLGIDAEPSQVLGMPLLIQIALMMATVWHNKTSRCCPRGYGADGTKPGVVIRMKD